MAHLAVVAIDRRLNDHALPGADDGAGRFMAQHHGVNGFRVADRTFGEVMQVRATDADRMYTDLDLARLWSRGSRLNEFETVWGDQLGAAHGKFILTAS